VLGISADDIDRGDPQKLSEEKNEIARFAEQMHIPYPVLIDGDSLSTPYDGLDSLPASYFVDRKGTVVAAQVGLTSKDEIEADIRKALGISVAEFAELAELANQRVSRRAAKRIEIDGWIEYGNSRCGGFGSWDGLLAGSRTDSCARR